jgi:hypothetical protein
MDVTRNAPEWASTTTNVARELPHKVRGFIVRRETQRAAVGVAVVAVAVRDGHESPVSVLSADRAGFVSFDLRAAVEQPVERLFLHALADPSITLEIIEKFEPQLHGPFVLSVPDDLPAHPHNWPSVQNPDVDDWECSPHSFLARTEVILGDDACEVPVPGSGVVHTVRFSQLARRLSGPIDGETLSNAAEHLTVDRDPVRVVGDLVRRVVQAGRQTMRSASSSSRLRLFREALAQGRGNARMGELDLAAEPRDRDRILVLCELLEYEQIWKDLGHSLGTLTYSLPLAPCESVNVAVIEATRSDQIARQDILLGNEQLLHDLRHDRSIFESVETALRETARGFSVSGGLGLAVPIGVGALTASVGAATTRTWGQRDLAADSVQDLHDSVVQSTGVIRSLHSTVVVSATQAETHRVQTRTITNHNHCHALTIQFYEVLRRLCLETRFVGSRPVILVPIAPLRFANPLTDPNKQDIDASDVRQLLRLRHQLEPLLLTATLSAGFEAARRLLFYDHEYGAEAGPAGPRPASAEPVDFVITRIRFRLKRGQNGTAPNPRWNEYAGVYLRLLRTDGTYVQFVTDPVPMGRDMTYFPCRTQQLSGQLDPEGMEWTNQLEAVLMASVRRSELRQAEIVWHPHRSELFAVSKFSFRGLDLNAPVDDGEKNLFLGQAEDPDPDNLAPQYKDFVAAQATRQLPIVPLAQPAAPTPATPDPTLVEGAKRRQQDLAAVRELISQLHDHRNYYSTELARRLPLAEYAELLDQALDPSSPLRATIDPVPIAVGASWVAFRWAGPVDTVDIEVPPPSVDIVSLPTRGMLGEAQLGHCNACETRDVTRFWQWEESPCPEKAPAIEQITPGFHGQPPDVVPTALPQSVVQITQPPAAPDPVGLAAAMTLLGKGDVFRDMSGSAELQQLLSGLASGAIDLAKARELASGATQGLAQPRDAGAYGGATRPPMGELDGAFRPDPRDAGRKVDDLQAARKADQIGRDLGWDPEVRQAIATGFASGTIPHVMSASSPGPLDTVLGASGAMWLDGPSTRRKSVKGSLTLAAYLGLVREVEARYGARGEGTKEIVQRLRRLYYGSQNRNKVGLLFDLVIQNFVADAHLGAPLTAPPLAQATLDRLYETDAVNVRGEQIDASHWFVAADIFLAGPSRQWDVLQERTGIDPRGLLTWVGDLAAWFVGWNDAKMVDRAKGVNWTPSTDVQRLKEAGLVNSRVALDDLLGDLDGQIVAAALATAAAGPGPQPAISDFIEAYYAYAVTQPHVTRRFERFLRQSAPAIPHTEAPPTVQVGSGAPQAVQAEISKAIRLFLKFERNSSTEPQELTTEAHIIRLIADDFCQFLRRGLAGEVVWPRP